MDRKILLIDMDGVMADYTARFFEVAFNKWPELEKFESKASLEWETEEVFPLEYRRDLKAMTEAEGFFAGIRPIDGAIEAIRELDGLFSIWICTTPKRVATHCVPNKYEWVKRHLGQKFVEKVIMTRDKTLVNGAYLIDDKPIIKGSVQPCWEHLLFDRPYNHGVTGKRRINWANWQSVLL